MLIDVKQLHAYICTICPIATEFGTNNIHLQTIHDVKWPVVNVGLPNAVSKYKPRNLRGVYELDIECKINDKITVIKEMYSYFLAATLVGWIWSVSSVYGLLTDARPESDEKQC